MHLDADALGLDARDGDFFEAKHLRRFAIAADVKGSHRLRFVCHQVFPRPLTSPP
jgi:hypothetical protein